jgi:hypothetical protein
MLLETESNLNFVHQANVESISLMQKGQHSNAARLQVKALSNLRTFISSSPDDHSHAYSVDKHSQNIATSMIRPFVSIDTNAPRHESMPGNGNNGSTDNGIVTVNNNNNNSNDGNMHEITLVQPHGFFNRAFCLVRDSSIDNSIDSASQTNLELLSIITLFNTALAFHRLGMAQNKARHFLTAIQIYDKVLLAIATFDCLNKRMLTAIQLASHLNKCHIYLSYYFDLSLAQEEQTLFVNLFHERSLHCMVDPNDRVIFALESNTLQYTFIIASAAA